MQRAWLWALVAVLACSGGSRAADGAASPLVVHNEAEFISGVRNTSVNLITISTCYLYLPSRVWVASGGVVFVGARQLLISRDPALLCRPVLDFNYAYGIFNVTGNGTLTFQGLQISKVQRVVPNALLHTPPPNIECGTCTFLDSALHNEMSAPLDKAILFFSNAPRPARFPGDQSFIGLPLGWCDDTSLVAPETASFTTWTPPPGPFIDLRFQQQPDAAAPHRMLDEIQHAMQQHQHRKLLGMTDQITGPASHPILNTSIVLASNVTLGHPCYLWAGFAFDVRLKMPSTPDSVGGCYEQWINTSFIANTNFPSSCLANKTTPICDKIWQNMLTANNSDQPEPLTVQLIDDTNQGVAAAPTLPAVEDSGSSNIRGKLAWIIPVAACVTVMFIAVGARIYWVLAHSHDSGDLDKGSSSSDKSMTNKRFWASVGSSLTAATQSMALLVARAPGGIRLGPLIGAGSFGRVYIGTWRGRKVAVKVIVHTAAETKRIQNELMLATMIKHPNCVETLFSEATTSALAQSMTGKGVNFNMMGHNLLGNSNLTSSSDAPSSSCGSRPSSQPSSEGALCKIVIAGQCGPITPLPTSFSGSALAQPAPHTCDKQHLLPDNPANIDAAATTDQNVKVLNDSALTIHNSTNNCAPTTNKQPFFSVSGSSSLLTEQCAAGHHANPLQGIRTSESWVVMEMCEGGSMSSAVHGGLFENEDGSKNMASILGAARDVAHGMQYLHQNKIIHGDLKCDNVLLQPLTLNADTTDAAAMPGSAPIRFIAKVADFGMSRILGADHTHMSTRACGTVTHCAPEYLRHGHLSTACDVYSFGVLLYELSTGQNAFAGQLHGGVVHAVTVLQARPAWPAQGAPIPDELKDLVQACWATLPSDRPTFTEVIERLDAMLMGVVPCAPVRTHPALLPFSLLASESTNTVGAQTEAAHALAAAAMGAAGEHAGFVSAAHAASSSYSVQTVLRDNNGVALSQPQSYMDQHQHLSGPLHAPYLSGSILAPGSATVTPAGGSVPSGHVATTEPSNLAAAVLAAAGPHLVTPAALGLLQPVSASLAVNAHAAGPGGLVTVPESEAEGCCTSSSMGTGPNGMEAVSTLGM